MSKINWEQKYKTLKKTFLNTIDTAFRTGFEQGYAQAQKEAQWQQMASMMQQTPEMGGTQEAQQGMGGDQQTLDQQMPQDPQQLSAEQRLLTQKAEELEQLLGKAEDIYSKKAEKSMLNLSGMFNKFNKNLTHLQKQNIVGQEKMVREILDKWKRQKKELEGDYDKAINAGRIKLE